MTDDEQVILVPEMITCALHGEYDPQAYFSEREILEMLADVNDWLSDGRILCPICLAEIAGFGE